MVTIPFIYFSILWIHIVRTRTVFCIASLLLFVYMIISFFSIIIVETNGYDDTCPYVKVQFAPTLLYCGLMTLVISPFLAFHDERIKMIGTVEESKYVDWLVYLYFFTFILLIVLTGKDIVRNQMLLSVNANLKGDIRFGREDLITSVSGTLLFIATKLSAFSRGSALILPVFFYSLCFWRKKIYYHFFILIGSTSAILSSLLSLDRSGVVYWLMIFIACFIFFYKFIPKKKKKVINILLTGFTSVVILYVIYMNTMRNSGEMEIHNLISYIGQSFLNFCTNYERLHLNDYSIAGVFPVLNKHVFGGEDLIYWYDYVARTHKGLFIMNFSTWAGEFLSEIGIFFTCLWAVVFNFISSNFLKRYNQEYVSFFKLIAFFLLLLVPYCGIFVHFYHNSNVNIVAFFILIIVYKSSKRSNQAYIINNE